MAGIGNALSLYVTLVFIMNPFGALPIYLDIVAGLHPWERRRIANIVALVATTLLILMAVGGDALLALYKISLDEFRFAGGVILMAVGISRLSGHAHTQTPDPKDAAVVPLATPLLVGPASMTYVIVAGAHEPLPAVVAAILAAVATVWLVFEIGEHLVSKVGRSAMRVMTRITALFVAGIGAAMIHAALVAWGIAKQ